VCAGRTDAGVHARTQMLSFDLPEGIDLNRIQRSVNSILGPEVVMRSLTVAPGFHARFDAQWRHYRYLVLNRPVNDPFLARTAWHVTDPLHLGWMRLGCDPLIGEHDFAAFCRPGVGPTTRRVVSADWFDDGDGALRFEIRANAFCQQMVRSIVGLLVEVGRGRRRAGDVTGVLQAKDRSHFGTVAPPNGLTLWDVGY
jgi:tRNA pseudouridine38-40 synthase